MTPDQPSGREGEIFQSALAIPSGEERERYLRGVCGHDISLLLRIQQLLRAHDTEDPGSSRSTVSVDPPQYNEQPGAVVARYKLLEKVGEGGFGVVYVAEQREPVKRRVALKIIKLGMDTKEVVARFEAERQALALMDHPNIAKVFDAGATESGRPFFVMELVRGIQITEYCDQNNLSTVERLQLFIQICHAIQHAHQKGIIHRDIKPSNILVTLHDGVPVPKVIDFGIAKATQQELTERTVYTQLHQFVGTPAYMSPEQAEMSGLDIDTRSDIYSLGVLLYELLTSRTPFDAKDLMRRGLDEVVRTLREVDPLRPSTRLNTLGADELTTAARRRGLEAPKLVRLLRGDIDWIVMKCLEKDRTRRYESASGVAADLRRFLSNEPVAARPPNAVYRFQKLFRRNKAAAFAIGSIAIALVVGLGLSTNAFLRERKARLAVEAADQARERASSKAQTESLRADEVVGFVRELFDAAVPELSRRGHQDAIKQLLATSDRLASRLTNTPITEAQLRLQIARANEIYLQDYPLVEKQCLDAERAGLRAGEPGRQAVALAHVYRLHARLLQHHDAEVREEFWQAGVKALSQSPPDTRIYAYIASNRANGLSWTNDHGEAERLARDCLRVAPDDAVHFTDRLLALIALCRSSTRQGHWSEATSAARQALEMFAKSPSAEDFRMKEELLRLYGRAAAVGGNFQEFEAALQDLSRRLPGADTATPVLLRAILGEALCRRGEWEKGFSLIREAATSRDCTIITWYTAMWMAVLLNDANSYRSLCVYGLARFAGGADDEISRRLLEGLSNPWSQMETHPIVQEFFESAQIGRPQSRFYLLIISAAIKKQAGRLAEAERDIDQFIRQSEKDQTASVADGYFVQATIKAKLGHTDVAREAYRKGLPLASHSFQDRSIPYNGEYWDEGVIIELTRREAAAALEGKIPQ